MKGTVWLCLGYGLCLAVSATGSAGLAHIVSIAGELRDVLVAQCLFLLETTGMWLVLSRLSLNGAVGSHVGLRRISFACSFAGLAISSIPSNNPFALWAGMAVYGASIAVPKLGWYESFLAVGKQCGRMAALVTIVASFILALLPACAVTTCTARGVAPLVPTAALLVCAWLCQEISCRQTDTQPVGAEAHKEHARYGLTHYALALLASFGATWGLTCSMLATASLAHNIPASTPLWVGGTVVLLGACLWPLGRRIPRKMLHYGHIIRCVIAAVGCSWAAVPLVALNATASLGIIFSLVFMLQGVVMVLLSVDICIEQGLSMRAVATLNYAVFTVAAAVAMWLYAILTSHLDGQALHAAISLAATAASLAIIPMLPSRNSQASSFTLETYPEDEDYQSRIKAKREGLANRYGLSQRELEVIELLLDGKTRNEIAQDLSLSPWTIKTHTSSIYEKMGIHSVKELILVVTDGSTY